VDVASGIPCGVAAKSGNDVDAIAIVFLRPPAAAVLDGVAYAGLPTSQARRGAPQTRSGCRGFGFRGAAWGELLARAPGSRTQQATDWVRGRAGAAWLV
jgi:hypothetical protein